MQVSQMSDAVTHAVLGKKNSVEMGVSDSAALMHIFSTTLYTYPKLATVREIICNGWDGHIVVGNTDTPLKITINEDFLSIRDFGPGIPDEKIGPIYGVFGNSTKRDDNTVTGGFGLGSKAPFAYTDNFEVTSHHNGVKTVYRVSKSSMERGGKPTIDTMVQLPTEETGIQVKIQMKSRGDAHEFLRLVTEVLILGEIKASINDMEPVNTLPLSESKTGYIISSAKGTLTSRINLRYGNVVYPIPRNEHYGEMWDQVSRVMNRLWDDAQVTFMAPPDTVTIAPSREALIFTEGTEETIKQLLMRFKPDRAKASMLTARELTLRQVNELIPKSNGATRLQDFREDMNLPAVRGSRLDHSTGPYAFDVRKAAINHMLFSRSLRVEGKHILQKRLRHAIYKGTVDKVVGKRFFRAIRHYEAACSSGHYRTHGGVDGILQSVLHREVTWPLLESVKASSVMDVNALSYACQKYENCAPSMVNPKKFTVGGSERLVGFLFKRVLLARSKRAIDEFFDTRRHWNSPNREQDLTGWIVYQLPKSDKHYADIEKVFADLGYEVTTHLPKRAVKEVDPNAPVKVAAPKKVSPKRKGYLTLKSSQNSSDNFLLSYARENCKPEEHTFDPVAYVVLNNAAQLCDRFSDLSVKAANAVNKLMGDRVAVVTTNQIEKLEAKGIPEVSQYIRTYVDDTLSTNPEFPRYLAFGRFFQQNQHHRAEGIDGLVRYMLQHDSLLKSFDAKFRFGLSAETEMLVSFFEDDSYHGTKKHLPKCLLLETKVKASPLVQEIPRKLRDSPWIEYIDVNRVAQALKSKQPDSDELSVPYEIVRNLMK